MKRTISMILALVMLAVWLPVSTEAEQAVGNPHAGKVISILGDSISTYANYSNGTAAENTNSTIGTGAVYYPRSGFDVTAESTWWHRTAQKLGMEILVNNSWSGSCLLNERYGTVGAYVDRCVQLHDDTGVNAGQKPDVIAIFLGTNDYYTYPGTLGSFEAIDFDALIQKGEAGYVYAEPVTSLEAYAIILHKISQAYSEAQVYCFTLLPRVNSSSQPTAFNEDICQLAQYFGVYTVDLNNCGILSDSTAFYKLMGDSLHPDDPGMEAIANAFVSALLKNSGLDTYDVSFQLEGAVAMEGAARTVVAGDAFETVLEALNASNPLDVTVTMNGVDISEDSVSGNRVTVPSVTGNITITAEPGQRAPMNFRWETQENALVSITGDGNTENALTMTHGTITDGVYAKTRFTMSQGISLRHDLPWCVEWKSSGTWTDTTDGALLFAEATASATADASYFYRRHKNDFFALGTYTGGKYHNYGVQLAGTGIDTTAEHVFRLENRIASDGSNMVYLLVDGEEVGPLNHHWIGGTDQKETSDWISGKDFTFSYMGTNPHTIGGCSIDYIQVWEAGKLSTYAGKVISILGDSISTFAGYIPVADGFNMEHLARYPQDDLLTDVNETWWMQVIDRLDAKLGINDSWRGATASGAAPVTTGTTGENASMANLTRIQNLGSNGTPDVILFYGGTNDLAHVSKVGTFEPSTAPTEADLTTKKWDNLADGYVNTILRLKYYYPDAQIVCLLPTYTTSYYSNEKLAQGNAVLASICEYYGVAYTDLRDCGITTGDLHDGIHPDAKGMDHITEAVLSVLDAHCNVTSGEHKVYSVSHRLKGATASLGHYKGIDAGAAFSEMLQGTDLTVTVTMGGQDITDACYSNGEIYIGAVTGDIVITAQASFSLEGRIQELPENHYGVNLWPVLKHDTDYYAADGWDVHPSGTVRSVTIPVAEGERIYASSFEAAPGNGGSLNGIRVTFFSENGVLVSMGAAAVYEEFSKNGCLRVPAEANAVSIPMWTDDDSWELYVRENDDADSGVHGEYLQPIPENSCCATNLWPLLNHDVQYYTANGWAVHSSGSVYSVTIPVEPGDKLWATSFQAAGSNGGTMNGIRLTWFGKTDVLESVSADKVYSEFADNGCLTAPEGTVAANVVMWTGNDSNELYILNREHIYENGTCALCGTRQTATFQILDTRCGCVETFTYEVGMTWKEWLNSKYNTGMGSCIAIWVSEGPDILGGNPYMDILVDGILAYDDEICAQDNIELVRYR